VSRKRHHIVVVVWSGPHSVIVFGGREPCAREGTVLLYDTVPLQYSTGTVRCGYISARACMMISAVYVGETIM
jgi:hypothetical protein